MVATKSSTSHTLKRMSTPLVVEVAFDSLAMPFPFGWMEDKLGVRQLASTSDNHQPSQFTQDGLEGVAYIPVGKHAESPGINDPGPLVDAWQVDPSVKRHIGGNVGVLGTTLDS